jgi:hypothetical protein
MERSPDVMTPAEKMRPLAEQKTLVQLVADAELMDMLEELKHLLAHQNFEGRMDILIKQVAGIALKKLKPAPSKTQQVTEEISVAKANATSPPRLKKRSRYIPVRELRKVLLRDQNGCTYRDPKSGRVCGSKHGLQLDHIVPFSKGGQHLAENLTLKCGTHNRYLAEKMGLRESG